MKILFLISSLFSMHSVLARDSQWSLCQGSTVLFGDSAKLVVNVFEHRNSTGDGRDTDITLIFGGHVLIGTLDTTESNTGKVLLKGCAPSAGDSYEGLVTIDPIKNKIKFSGSFNIPDPTPLNAQLKCKLLAD